jgi:hypothetical protein
MGRRRPTRSEAVAHAVVVSVLVSVALVLFCSPRRQTRLRRSLQTSGTLINTCGGNLESGLGASPRGFESRILRGRD